MTTNIIFLVIDSFRSDRFFGSDRSCKTPNIDFLINRGLYCKNTIGGADSTGIAIGNCITGKYSFKNGINQIDLNSKTITLFDILKNHGKLCCSLPEGLDVLRMIDAAEKSAKAESWQKNQAFR